MASLSNPGNFASRASEMPMEAHLEKHFEKLKAKADFGRIEDLLETIYRVVALIAAQGQATSRRSLVHIMIQMTEKSKEIAGTYNSKPVWVLTLVGAGVSIVSSLYFGSQMTQVIARGGDSQLVYSTIQALTAKQSGGSAIGQAATSGSQMWSSHDTGKRTVLENASQRSGVKRDALQAAVSAKGQEKGEANRSILELIEKIHRAASAA